MTPIPKAAGHDHRVLCAIGALFQVLVILAYLTIRPPSTSVTMAAGRKGARCTPRQSTYATHPP